MALRFFNTLSRSVQDFVPLDPGGKRVGMYCCGPTVYDFGHIGNFRTFVFADLVRRHLEFRGYQVTHVMNITDVEDKIIRRVRETGETLADYTGRYESAFLADCETLRLRAPHHRPRATDHIGPIIGLIRRLEANGFAYVVDGSVYFSIDRYRGAGRCYGQLLNLDLEQLRTGERVRNDEYAKEAVADFALWKARSPEDGDVFWPSPWGEGRPGWHIECSAMSMQLLGASFDLHLGGEDLVFPHHEDEIAQSEGAAPEGERRPFVKYWLHGAHLLVEGKKMSKSLGNFFTLRDLLERGFSGREIRYLLLSAHYRDSFNFTLDGLAGARTALGRIDECVARLRETAGNTSDEPATSLLDRFTEALDDDLNVSAAWGSVFDWVRDLNRRLDAGALSPADAAAELAAWQRIDTVFDVANRSEAIAPPEILALVEERQAARKARDFPQADVLRKRLLDAGWLVEDTPKGPRVKRA
ncbi:MAG: cysteine--tRNA ligase [Verrucomicrobiales bacterium]|nr:cysteine--tRNA ligase [Verrucomicrobiales bacterium]